MQCTVKSLSLQLILCFRLRANTGNYHCLVRSLKGEAFSVARIICAVLVYMKVSNTWKAFCSSRAWPKRAVALRTEASMSAVASFKHASTTFRLGYRSSPNSRLASFVQNDFRDAVAGPATSAPTRRWAATQSFIPVFNLASSRCHPIRTMDFGSLLTLPIEIITKIMKKQRSQKAGRAVALSGRNL